MIAEGRNESRTKRRQTRSSADGQDCQCVYCLAIKSRSQFNREHVVPTAFGKFQNAPVLRLMVCAECNTYFSKHLDLVLARASPEGLERYRWGIRPASDHAKFKHQAVPLTARIRGDYSNALLELRQDPNSDKLRARPRAQVGFPIRDTSEFKYFTLDQLSKGAWMIDAELQPHRGVKLIECDFDQVKAILASHGIKFKEWRPLTPPTVSPDGILISQEYAFPQEYLRAIAKIAFNHMALINGPRFALRTEFDSVRKFIRRGREPFLPTVMLRNDEIFRPPASNDKKDERPVVHIVTTTQPLNAEVVLGQVTLFNATSYDVALAFSNVRGLKQGGYLFNVRTRKAHLLVHKKGRKAVKNSQQKR